MSKKTNPPASTRWKLLASVSAMALIAAAYGASEALGADDGSSHPQLWLELGSQLERASGGDGAYPAPFYSHFESPVDSPAKVGNELPWSLGPEGKITFQPENSDWLFSAGIRYGRAKSHRNTQQQSHPKQYKGVGKYYVPRSTTPGGAYHPYQWKCCYTKYSTPDGNYAVVQSRHEENHLVLDFQAGKDVGLGLFGKQSTSTVSAGVRFAQFRTRSDISVKAETDLQIYNGFTVPSYAHYLSLYPQKYSVGKRFHVHALTAGSERSFRGIGPSISWDASAALLGSPETSELTFDWGINGAILFGKQRSKTHHQNSGSYHRYKYGVSSAYNHPRVDFTRSRNVTVPNIGGMAGFSIRFPNAKVSIGYRADIFLNAMDGGWDIAKKQNRNFMGPFASISVGMGD